MSGVKAFVEELKSSPQLKITDETSILSSPTHSFSVNSNLIKKESHERLLTISKQGSLSSLVGTKRRTSGKRCQSERADSTHQDSTVDPLEEMLCEALRDRTTYHNNKKPIERASSFNRGTTKN